MKEYFTYCKLPKTGEEKAIKVKGYLYNDRYGRQYGARKEGYVWQITELSSGLLANSKVIYKRKEIQEYIDKIADTVIKLFEGKNYQELIIKFNELKRKAENENENI